MKCKHCGSKDNWRCYVRQSVDVEVDKNGNVTNNGFDFSDPDLREETLHCGVCGEFTDQDLQKKYNEL